MNILNTQRANSDAPQVNEGVWFIVPAAGVGQRMGAAIPKQYLPFLESTIIETTLSTLLQIECVVGVVVAVHPEDAHWKSLSIASDPRIHTVEGGAERSDSVLAGLQFLETRAADNQWILVHDAARPCIHVSSVLHLLTRLSEHPVGGILGVRCSDTLKSVNEDENIESTVDRRHIWQAQTPQMFRYRILYSALFDGLRQQRVITDEASAIEQAGLPVAIVEGRRDNIKITQPDDIVVAEAIYQSHHNALASTIAE